MKYLLKSLLLAIALIAYLPSHANSYKDFFRAIVQDDANRVALLVRRGFDVNTRDPNGDHPLMIAIRIESKQVVKTLLSTPDLQVEARNLSDESALMMAALIGDHELVERLIALDADVNKPGWTPLHYAATKGHVAVMQVLLDHDAYIDAESPNGSTPLMMAAMYGTPSAVKLLLSEGADASLKNQLGLTAIDFALKAEKKESARMITEHLRAKEPGKGW